MNLLVKGIAVYDEPWESRGKMVHVYMYVSLSKRDMGGGVNILCINGFLTSHNKNSPYFQPELINFVVNCNRYKC